nr:uncharacterized mitochondrial protein AtMg00810-like [Tanacetum cinerariifolium]
TIVATSTTEAEYVATASGCGQLLSMIGLLMYLTASRPDIMFVVCACVRHQVTPKDCHLYAVKRIFRYLKGHPKLGLWYPKESPFDLVAYSNSDYGGATQDRKSTTGGCQFLGRRLISWQCKKQTIVATSTTGAEYMAAASGCGQVLWIQNQMLDYRSDSEQRTHEFIHVYLTPASVYVWIGYALTFKPTVYVSHIRQFWSTARIETTDEGTKILATVDGILIIVFESSIRRNLKLTDEAGIRQFSHQWKYLIHTIMQCLSPKSTGFNEFSSNIATALVCLATNRIYNFSKMIFDGMGEGSGTPTEPHHTPSSKAQQTSPTTYSSPRLPPVTTAYIPPVILTASLPTVVPTDTPHIRHYTRRARIAQSSALPPDRENIAKTSTLPSDLTSRVTSLTADEGSMQHKLDELTALCTSLQRQQSETVAKFEAQELEINSLKARIKVLEDKDRGVAEQFEDDAPIKGRRLDVGEEAAKRVSDDTEEMATVLTSMDATTVLSSRVAKVPTGSGSIPTADPLTTGVPTGSDVVPTAGLIFATATVVTPYTRRKGKEKMIESETPKTKKIQEHMDIQMARQLEEEMERDAQRMNEQISRDAEIAKIHAEEELQMMINSLDRGNEIVAKYLQEYEQIPEDLSIGYRIELISDLVKYQENYAQVLKYQTLQRKPRSKKQKKDYYMAVIKGHAGWKTKGFKGMSFEQIKAKFNTESAKKLKTSEEVPEELKSSKEVPEEKVKEMMQLVPVEEIFIEALQVKHPIIDRKHLDREDLNQLWRLVKESLIIRPAASDKEMELWDYPLRKDLAIMMISYKLQVENYFHMANDLIMKIYKVANCPSQQVMEFPLPEEVPIASEESSHGQKKRDPTAVKIHTATKVKNILEEESIGFARFNTIIISLEALDEGFSSKNYVRKFLRALHSKWRAKFTSIEESKFFLSLALDELIGNLKVHEVVMEKDSEIYKGKKKRVKSITLKAKKESSDDETLTSRSDDEEYVMAVRNFKKFFRRKDVVIQIISLEIVQNNLATKIKRPSLEVLGAIAKMTPKTKLTMKLVSWLNRQMRGCITLTFSDPWDIGDQTLEFVFVEIGRLENMLGTG